MDAYIDIWSDRTWWVVFVVSLAIGLAGALGVLDRAEAPLER
jgi:hypothetical protein